AIDPALRPAIETWILARKAQRLFELEEWAHAGAAYQKLVERRSADGEAYSRLGVARLMEGRPQDAIAAFERQCELNWRRPLGEFNLGAANARAGNLDEAAQRIAFAVRIGFGDLEMLQTDPDLDPIRQRDEFREAIETVERAAELQAAADKAFERGDWAAAGDLWSQVLELTPWNTRAIHLRGYCEIATGAYDDAIASYGRLLEINVMVPLACYNTACAASLKGDRELALASLERAIDSGFRDYKLLSSDGDLDGVRADPAFERIEQKLLKTARLAREIELASEFGDWTAAQAAAEALIQIDPNSADAWGRLGTARLAQGDAPGAAEAFARQVATGRDVAEGLYSLAAALAAQQRHAEALAHLGAAIDAGFADGERLESDKALAPLRDAPGFERITQALTDAGVLSNFGAVDWSHLLDRSQQRAAESPEDGRNRMRLGWAHLRLGHYDEAIAAFSEQRRLGFAPGIAQYNIACALALSGRSGEAMEALEQSLQYGYIDPEHAATDLDLKTLRSQPRFDAFLDKARRMRKADRDGDSMVY
ncbi:MAG: tetratricopeptide repeat protein, partial [Phycisphaerales bacterium JB039]